MDVPQQLNLLGPTQGRLDDQLELGDRGLDLMRRPLPVWKRSGIAEAFDTEKLARAISQAARAAHVEGADLSHGLASGVALYLNRTHGDGSPLTSSDVHAATERVLIEMGYRQVAAAYARRREQRTRLGALRSDRPRDPRAADDGAGSSTEISGVVVANSDETESTWDRTRVSRALLRETTLNAAAAGRIAEEVERRVHQLGMATVTSGLVRELVGALLLAQGNVSERARHLRLGIPLYDAEQTIRGNDGVGTDPDRNERALAGRLKREFALARVFGRDVAEAQRWGDIDIVGLDSVDRVASLTASPDWVKLHGLPGGAALRPRRADTLIAQMAGANATLRRSLTDGVTWDAVNWTLAPFFAAHDGAALYDLARVLVHEFAYRNISEGTAARDAIGLCWSLPERLWRMDVIGPRGDILDASYDDFGDSSRGFARSILSLYAEIAETNPGLTLPRLHITVADACFADPGFGAFLIQVAEAVRHWPVRVRFARGVQLYAFEDDSSAPRDVLAQEIVLNLARAAYRSASEMEFQAECTRLLELAADAHTSKRAFLRDLLERGQGGPLGILAKQRWVSAEQLVFVTAPGGLHEAGLAMLGAEAGAEERRAFEGRTLALLRERTERLNADRAMETRIAAPRKSDSLRRLAEQDLRYYGDRISDVVDTKDPEGSISYRALEYGALEDREATGAGGYGHLHAAHEGVLAPEALRRSDAHDIALAIERAYRHGFSGLEFPGG